MCGQGKNVHTSRQQQLEEKEKCVWDQTLFSPHPFKKES